MTTNPTRDRLAEIIVEVGVYDRANKAADAILAEFSVASDDDICETVEEVNERARRNFDKGERKGRAEVVAAVRDLPVWAVPTGYLSGVSTETGKSLGLGETYGAVRKHDLDRTLDRFDTGGSDD